MIGSAVGITGIMISSPDSDGWFSSLDLQAGLPNWRICLINYLMTRFHPDIPGIRPHNLNSATLMVQRTEAGVAQTTGEITSNTKRIRRSIPIYSNLIRSPVRNIRQINSVNKITGRDIFSYLDKNPGGDLFPACLFVN